MRIGVRWTELYLFDASDGVWQDLADERGASALM